MAETERRVARKATHLPPEATSIPAARHFAVDALTELGGGPRDEIELLVSELTTNAIVHARTPLLLTMCRKGTRVRVEVMDDDPTPPRVNLRPDPLRPGGRGMCLVNALAADWGVNVNDHGKTVWFEVAA